MTTSHTEKCEGLTIKIIADEDAENPFKSWDGEPDIIGWHRRYDFNTRKEDKGKEPSEFLREAKEQGYIVKPLYMYDHSGIGFSTGNSSYPFNCPWDSGQYGFIFWTKEKIEQGQGKVFAKRLTAKKRTMLEGQLDNAVSLLNDYVSGNVWGFVVEDKEGNDIDSCWGFYGDYEQENGCLNEARSVAKSAAQRIKQEKAQAKIDLGKTLGLSA